ALLPPCARRRLAVVALRSRVRPARVGYKTRDRTGVPAASDTQGDGLDCPGSNDAHDYLPHLERLREPCADGSLRVRRPGNLGGNRGGAACGNACDERRRFTVAAAADPDGQL